MSLSIGILDDDENVLFTFQAMAKTQHWQVFTSTSFDDVKKWFVNGSLDLLLLDYHMPLMNGIEALKNLRKLNSTIPILMLTIEQDPVLAESLLMEGADDFISKPIRLADFVARVHLHEKLAKHQQGVEWEKNGKGMSAGTRRRILKALQGVKHAATIREIASETGLSYPTTHRYLDHLYQQKIVNRTESVEPASEGRPGRPVVRYSPISLLVEPSRLVDEISR